jgi:hypothetical protein
LIPERYGLSLKYSTPKLRKCRRLWEELELIALLTKAFEDAHALEEKFHVWRTVILRRGLENPGEPKSNRLDEALVATGNMLSSYTAWKEIVQKAPDGSMTGNILDRLVRGNRQDLARILMKWVEVEVVDSYAYKALKFDLLKATSACANHPTVSIRAPEGTVILGGGAYVDWDGPGANFMPRDGNLITGMFPSDDGATWTVSAKDHQSYSPASVVAYCIVAQKRDKTPIPKEYYKIVSQTSDVAHHPTQEVNLPTGFSIVGGGVRANYKGHGSMVYASNPTPELDGWVGCARDHRESDPASITVWAIGLKQSFLQELAMLADLSLSSKTTTAATHHPRLTVVTPDFHMTGGGGRVNWDTAGSFLTAAFPQDRQTWVAEGKDHFIPEPTTITAYTIGFKASG